MGARTTSLWIASITAGLLGSACSAAPTALRRCEVDADCRAGEGCVMDRCTRVTDAGVVPMLDTGGDDDGGGTGTDVGSTGSTESMCDGFDSDFDGRVDEGCSCTPGETQACYPGEAATLMVGPCEFGTQGCDGAGEFGTWTECLGAVVPTEDDCGDRLDDDCNGSPDDGPACVCGTGDSRPCYDGPGYSRGVGTCADGQQECSTVPGVGWGECLDDVLPRGEICSNGRDDDCNGAVDDGIACSCTEGMSRECYSGPRDEAGVGICRHGMQMCITGGTMWTACMGEVGPMTEICGNGLDDDCDGMENEGCPTTVTVGVNLDGDCLTARCPVDAPYPVGCMINMAGGDPRGCIASSPTSPVVYFQEGNACGAGRVTGTLSCSSTPGAGLNATNCLINKPTVYYPAARSGCPAT